VPVLSLFLNKEIDVEVVVKGFQYHRVEKNVQGITSSEYFLKEGGLVVKIFIFWGQQFNHLTSLPCSGSVG